MGCIWEKVCTFAAFFADSNRCGSITAFNDLQIQRLRSIIIQGNGNGNAGQNTLLVIAWAIDNA